MPGDSSLDVLAPDLSLLREMAQEWARIFPQAAGQAQHWQQVLSQVQAHLAEDVRRVAVVGTVKAGKSTLVNALLGREVLRRGAGILTAMITRVRSGQAPRAVLRFKDWEEVNREMHRALGLFPDPRLYALGRPLEARRADDRALLAQVLDAAQGEGLWSKGGLNEDYLLLTSFLAGYEAVAGFIEAGSELVLTGAEVARHQQLVTREATAVYLKDVELAVPAPGLPPGVEVGDCQGSDSPIPQHLAQVLAYLLKTDLVLYVVSSRVGLRQGDFQFLSELVRMGLAPHLLFLLNLDLTELKTPAEIEALSARLRQELTPLMPDPPVFAFSALQMLLEGFQDRGDALEPREAALLAVWQAEPATADLSRKGARRFGQSFLDRLAALGAARLAGGGLAQVRMVAGSLREQLELTRKLLGKDLRAFESLVDRLQQRRRPLLDARQTLKRALAGAVERIKATLKNRVSSFLDPKYGQGALLGEFVKNYEPDWERLAPAASPDPFRFVLHRLFQDFQEELERFAASELMVRLMEFVRTQEDWLKRELMDTAGPLVVSMQDALALYYREAATMGLTTAPPELTIQSPELSNPPELPLFSLTLDPGWRWTGEAWVRSGMGTARRLWEKFKGLLGLKTSADPRAQLLRDLHGALKAIKEWLQEEVRINLLDFGERLKFRYFFPLSDALTAQLQENLHNLLGALTTDLEGVAEAMQAGEADREARRRRAGELLPRVREIETRLAALDAGLSQKH